MFYTEYLYDVPLWGSFLVLFISLAVFMEIGFRIGRRMKERGATGGTIVSSLSGTLVGLLALLLGFSFAVSLNRFDTRKQMLRDEVNELGSAAFSIDLLPAEGREKMMTALEKYAQERKDFYWDALPPEKVAEHLEKTYNLQCELWTTLLKEVRHSGLEAPLQTYIITVFDKAISQQTNRLVARNNHVPEPILWLLFVLACICGASVGYASGLNGARAPIVRGILCLCICLVMTIILDLDHPRRGFIRVDQQPMVDLLVQLKKNEINQLRRDRHI